MDLLHELLTKLFFLRFIPGLLPGVLAGIFMVAGVLERADLAAYAMSANANSNHLQVPQLQ